MHRTITIHQTYRLTKPEAKAASAYQQSRAAFWREAIDTTLDGNGPAAMLYDLTEQYNEATHSATAYAATADRLDADGAEPAFAAPTMRHDDVDRLLQLVHSYEAWVAAPARVRLGRLAIARQLTTR